MEIFPLKGSWFSWDRNPSETELLEGIRTVFSYHPKCKRAESHSTQPAGILSENQLTLTASSWSTKQDLAAQQGNYKPHSITAVGEMLLPQLTNLETLKSLDTPLHQPSTPSPSFPKSQGYVQMVSSP